MRSLVAAPLLLLLLLAAPALLQARYSGELLRPFGISAQSNQDALLSFSPFGVSTFSPRLALRGDDSACCDCVQSVGRHIIESALQAVATACANVSCPVLKQRCEWIEGHQAEFTGVLAVELRPLTDGYMYCYGNGTCDHPGVPKSDISSALFMADSSANPQLLLSQIAAAAPFVERALETRIDDETQSLDDNDDEKDSRTAMFARRIGSEERKSNRRFARRHAARSAGADSNETAAGVAEHKKRDCHSCLRHGVRWVLKRSIRHLKAACKATKCPHFAKFCAWAKEHKETVRGMLYAHVQPWKAASGYCAGNGSCHCGSRRHGDAAEPKQQEASMANAPFTMGEKEKEEERDEKEQPQQPPQQLPQPPVVIGGGKHDHLPHGPAKLGVFGAILNKMRN